jgi:predicted DCC family thiol-disulfide oxidoreductase YuxK
MQDPSGKPVILFDGVCNFCNAGVQFIIKRDKKNLFLFASLQSEFGNNFLLKNAMKTTNYDTFILFKEGRIFTKSRAALEVARNLGGLWKLLYSFIVIPWFVRDFLYDLIAKNRYKLFGKKDQCMIPSKEQSEKFLA